MIRWYRFSCCVFVAVFATVGVAIPAHAGPGDPIKGINIGAIKKPNTCCVQDGIDAPSDNIPPNGEWYVKSDPNSVVEWHPPGKAIREQGVQLTVSQGASPVQTPNGDWHVDSVFDITYGLFLQVDNGPTVEHTGSGTMHIVGTAPGDQGTPLVFHMEVLSLSMNGLIDATTPFVIHEAPFLPSLGTTTLTELPDGEYHITSFFDVFTELSIDGGATWWPGQGVPEPTSICLAVLCGMSLFGASSRRKRLS